MNESNGKKQAAALWILGILVVILIAVIVGLFIMQAQTRNKELAAKDEKIEQIEQELAQVKNQLQQVEQKNNLQSNNTITTEPNNVINTSIENNKTNNSDNTSTLSNIKENELLSPEKIDEILGNESTRFCVTNVSEQEDGYILTANILENDYRIISEEERSKIISGEKLHFRGEDWTFAGFMGGQQEDYAIVKSGKKEIVILRTQTDIHISNPAGRKTRECDFSGHEVKFKVAKNILICGDGYYFKYDDNGTLKQYEKSPEGEQQEMKLKDISYLREIYNTYSGSSQACQAIVKNGKVEAIQQCY